MGDTEMKKMILPDTRFKLGKSANPRDDQKRSYDKLAARIEVDGGSATYDALIASVRLHPAGPEGFVKYAIKNGWLERV